MPCSKVKVWGIKQNIANDTTDPGVDCLNLVSNPARWSLLYTGTSALIIYSSNIQRTEKYSAVRQRGTAFTAVISCQQLQHLQQLLQLSTAFTAITSCRQFFQLVQAVNICWELWKLVQAADSFDNWYMLSTAVTNCWQLWLLLQLWQLLQLLRAIAHNFDSYYSSWQLLQLSQAVGSFDGWYKLSTVLTRVISCQEFWQLLSTALTAAASCLLSQP